MDIQEISEGVVLARSRLNALRARFDAGLQGEESREIVSALSELDELMQKLHESFGLSRQILDHTNDMVCAKDPDGLHVMINPRGAAMFGKSVAEVLGSDDRDLLGSADAERIMAVDREVMRTSMSQTRDETLDLQGGERILLVTTSPWWSQDQSLCGVIVIAREVTDERRKLVEVARHEGRMRSMAAETMLAEENLRRSLAAELHGGLGQYIALARLKVSMLRSSTEPELHDSLAEIEQIVELADRSMRAVTHQFSPHLLHAVGLVAALKWLGEDFSERHGLEVTFQGADTLEVVGEQIRVILFRAVRELLFNVLVHANVGTAAVHLAQDGIRVRITVGDEGVGFDLAEVERHGHGLLGIREQLKYVGGEVLVESTPGVGTSVTISAPHEAP